MRPFMFVIASVIAGLLSISSISAAESRAFLAPNMPSSNASPVPAADVRLSSEASSPDDTAIRSFWSGLDAIWGERAAKPFSELFTLDGNFEFVDRSHRLEGRQAIYNHFLQQFPKLGPELAHRTIVRNIQRIAAGMWAVDGTVNILRTTADDGGAETLKTFAIFALMLKTDAGWRIRELRAFELPMASAASG